MITMNKPCEVDKCTRTTDGGECLRCKKHVCDYHAVCCDGCGDRYCVSCGEQYCDSHGLAVMTYLGDEIGLYICADCVGADMVRDDE